jgi:hypothetical protein
MLRMARRKNILKIKVVEADHVGIFGSVLVSS